MPSVKPDTKYYRLYERLRASGADSVSLTFSEIEALLNAGLPDSARAARAWWSNRSKGALQAAAWMQSGYHVVEVDLKKETVVFGKQIPKYVVRREGDAVLWDDNLIKALRLHMGLNQAQFAEELSVRQQTISEWETGAYAPRRSMSKLLTIVAERAGFEYGEES